MYNEDLKMIQEFKLLIEVNHQHMMDSFKKLIEMNDDIIREIQEAKKIQWWKFRRYKNRVNMLDLMQISIIYKNAYKVLIYKGLKVFLLYWI